LTNQVRGETRLIDSDLIDSFVHHNKNSVFLVLPCR
jgi:hypothetical protein